jgi:lysophospholipase L1-like esterase/mannose-6-phosphate isomerase-like protein (cupin superfamily)
MKLALRFLLLAALSLPASAVADRTDDTPIRVFLAGDSTMSVKLPEKRPETGWGEMLQAWFDGGVEVVNLARNGRSTRTFIEEGRWDDLLARLRAGDYVFIQFGHNDQSEQKVDRYTPPDRFRANLVRFVEEVRKHDARPVLLTPVVRRRFDENGVFYDVHGVYPDLTRAAAAETETPLIDMHARSETFVTAYGAERSRELFLWLGPGESANYPDGLEDNTHFSPYGARAMAALAMQGIEARLPELAAHLVKRPNGVQHERDVVEIREGPHSGGGEATGYWFFRDFEGLDFIVRKTVLHPGSTIGYHLHDKDEGYYILGGRGELMLNGERSEVGPGTAILTRPGDAHGLAPLGGEDLVVLVVYEKKRP